MTRTRVVLLGTGFIADIHLESYRRFVPEAEVVAVFSRNAETAETFAKAHGVPRWSANLDEVIGQTDCDVVDVCLPISSIIAP